MNRRAILSHLTRAEVQALPAALLRELTLEAFDRELEASRHFEIGGTANALFHYVRSAEGAPEHGLIVLQGDMPTTDRLDYALGRMRSDPQLLEEFHGPGAYLGIGVMFDAMMGVGVEGWNARPVRMAADPPATAVPVRVVGGITADGGEYFVRRDFQGSVLAEMEFDPVAAAVRFNSTVMPILREMHVFLMEDYDRRVGIPDPEATLDDLVHWPGPYPDSLRVLGGRGALTYVTWSLGQPRIGRTFPPMPAGHPLADRVCGCAGRLADGGPIGEVVLGTGKDDPHAGLAVDPGVPVRAVAALVHRRCVHESIRQIARGYAAGVMDASEDGS